MQLTSIVFDAGGTIPKRYIFDGQNVSPHLMWDDVPQETQSLTLICDDPDSSNGAWSHWVIYNIPTDNRELVANPTGQLPWCGLQEHNDFGEIGYGGPYPTLRETHRYYWQLDALDAPCDLGTRAMRAKIFEWMQDHKLASSNLMARLARSWPRSES
jgi:Raf kinase inhibitor-like YbhB/YbcL family protein